MTRTLQSVLFVSGHLIACALAPLAVGCADEVLDPARERRAVDDGAPVTAVPAVPANLAPLRRLTAIEYSNAVRDLFPDQTIPALTFPAETSANGFLNNAAVQNPSPVLIEAYQRAAGTVAAAVVSSDKAPCKGSEPSTCAPAYLTELVGRMFRRPLSEEEQKAFVDFFTQRLATTNANVAMRLALAAMLQSPQFIYRIEVGRPDARAVDETGSRRLTDYETATRLSFLLVNSTPDKSLLSAAAEGALGTPAELEVHARRLLADPRARAAMVRFHEQWLDFQHLETTQKDAKTFPTWSEGLRAAMRKEGELFVEKTLFEGEGTLAALLTSPRTWINRDLAELYGVPAPATEFGPVALDPSRRGGVLTLPIFLASQGHQVDGSPTLRGKFILERFLCAPPPPPPPDANVSPPTASATSPKTNRQRYAVHADNPGCAGCHARMDGLGFPFESFDSLGRFRTTDNGEPVDTSGVVAGTGVNDGPVKNVGELAQRLATSNVVEQCVTTEWFRYAFGRSEVTGDAITLGEMQGAFTAAGGNVRELVVAIVKHPAFTFLPRSTP